MTARVCALIAALMTVLSRTSALAQCDASNLNRAATLSPELLAIVGEPPPKGNDQAAWSDAVERIDRLRRFTREEAARSQLHELDELANLLDAILEGYDGTGKTAHLLRFAEVKPRTCDPDPETRLPRCAWQILGGKVEVPWADDAPWTCPVKTLFRGHVEAAATLIARLVDPQIAKVAQNLKESVAEWQRYVEKGFSQYPHEVFLNGLLLDEQSWGPPAHQIILLHPAVGVGTTYMKKHDDQHRQGAMVLIVEGAGYVHYLGGFRHHLGASVAGILPNFEWSQVGVGPMIHFDGVGIGYGFGLKDDKPQTLFVTFDVTRGIDDGMLGKQAKKWVQDRLH